MDGGARKFCVYNERTRGSECWTSKNMSLDIIHII